MAGFLCLVRADKAKGVPAHLSLGSPGNQCAQ